MDRRFRIVLPPGLPDSRGGTAEYVGDHRQLFGVEHVEKRQPATARSNHSWRTGSRRGRHSLLQRVLDVRGKHLRDLAEHVGDGLLGRHRLQSRALRSKSGLIVGEPDVRAKAASACLAVQLRRSIPPPPVEVIGERTPREERRDRDVHGARPRDDPHHRRGDFRDFSVEG